MSLLIIIIVLLFFLTHSMLYLLNFSDKVLSLAVGASVAAVFGFVIFILDAYLHPIRGEAEAVSIGLTFLFAFIGAGGLLGFLFSLLFILKIRLSKRMTMCGFFISCLVFGVDTISSLSKR